MKTMMRIVALAATCCISATASAFQFGLGVAAAQGSGEFTDYDNEFDTKSRQYGLIFDFGSWERRVGNRLILAYSDGTLDSPDNEFSPGIAEIDSQGAAVSDSIRINLFVNPVVRAWIGPSFYLGIDGQKGDKDFGDGFYYGAGPSLGMDFAVSNRISLLLSAEYRVGRVDGSGDGDAAPGETPEEITDYKFKDFLIRFGVLFGT